MKLSYFENYTDSSIWNQLLREANVFFQKQYKDYCEESGRRVIYVYSDNYVVPVELTRKLFFYYSTFSSEPYNYSSKEENLQDFLTEVCSYIRYNFKVQWINALSTAILCMAFPRKSKYIPFGSHIIDLSLSEEELWSKIHSKHRNVIKKSEKDGVVIEFGRSEKLIQDYHSLDVMTWKRSNISDSGLEAIRNQLKYLGDNAIIYMAYYEGEPQSGALFYYNSAMCYYMFGANCDKPHTGAGNFLQWKAILNMKEAGVKKYSFVGCRINEDENSKYHSIQRIKERFGGELVQGFLFKVIFNKSAYWLFNLLVSTRMSIALKSLTKYQDIIDQEYYKWEK